MGPEVFARPPATAPSRGAGLTDSQVEQVFRASIVVLLCLTAAMVLVPGVHGHAVAPTIDLALDTLAFVVSFAVMALSWVNFSERRGPMALFQAAAFACLTIAYGTAVVISLGRDQDPTTLAHPISLQNYVYALARVLAAALIVIGGTRAAARIAATSPRLVFIGPAVAPFALAALGLLAGLAPPPGLEVARLDPDGSGLPTVTPVGVVVYLAVAALSLQAALVCRARWRVDREAIDAWMAIALVFAAFAEVNWVVYPVGHPGQVSASDVLRLVFFLTLLIGIEAGARQILGRLRAANTELAALREADVERAALEERARLARELHDGLAQDLWLAKLKVGELATLPDMPAAAGPLMDETQAAIDTGLAEARQAVMALRLAADDELGFEELMRRYIEDFEDRFGLRVEFSSEGDTSVIAPRTQAEVLRIAQEALVNVRQHAAASVVGVRLAVAAEDVQLRIVDNGRGFDPESVQRTSFGLASMRERAALIGGRISISSAPGNGTSISLTAPLGPTATVPGSAG